MKKKFNWKKAIYIVLGIIFAGILVLGISYLVKSNKKENEAFLTRKPTIKTWKTR